MRGFDVITMGRVGVDLYPLERGSLVDVKYFQKFLGGSPTNVAVAVARLGERSAVITRTGHDPFGDYVIAALRGFGVDDRFVSQVPGLQTPVTFCELFPPDHFPIYFYRQPTAPDLEIYAAELDLAAIHSARLLWATVSGLSVEPSRSATIAALSSRERRSLTVLDLDFRPTFWHSVDEVGTVVRSALRYATVAVGNVAEVEAAVGTTEPDAAADRLLELGVNLVIVKLGPAGVLAKSCDERLEVQAKPINVVNGLGAGDAFGGALCHGLLAGWSLLKTVTFANAAGAIVASRLSCSEAMPTVNEIEELLERAPRA